MNTLLQKDWVRLLPLLFLYLGIIIYLYSPELEGDEVRYVYYAENLLDGFYIDPEEPEIRNAPLYPIFIATCMFLGLPFFIPTILNAFFMYGGVLFFQQTLKRYISPRQALIWAFIFGLFPIPLHWLHRMIYEMMTIFLVGGFIYHFSMAYDAKRLGKNHIFAGIFWGLLILTKYIFAFVSVAGIFILGFFYIFLRRGPLVRAMLPLAIGFVFLLPYVFYTYKITDRFFYLSTSSGEYSYWMSSPYEGEWGTWLGADLVIKNKIDDLHPSHREFFLKVDSLPPIERNDAFKIKGKERIKKNPKAYLKNYVATQLRLLFNYPITHDKHGLGTYFYIIPNMFFVVLLVLSLCPAVMRRKSIPMVLWILVGIMLIYHGGVSLNLGKPRHLLVSYPVFFFWLAYLYSRIIKVSLLDEEENTVGEKELASV